MPLVDLPLDQLRTALAPAQDLADRWAATLAEARGHDLDVRREPVDAGLSVVDVEDVSFAGCGGEPVRAWLHRPVGRRGPLPVVAGHTGYGGGAR